MDPAELIQLMRTKTLSQVKAALEALQKESPMTYMLIVGFYKSVK